MSNWVLFSQAPRVDAGGTSGRLWGSLWSLKSRCLERGCMAEASRSAAVGLEELDGEGVSGRIWPNEGGLE